MPSCMFDPNPTLSLRVGERESASVSMPEIPRPCPHMTHTAQPEARVKSHTLMHAPPSPNPHLEGTSLWLCASVNMQLSLRQGGEPCLYACSTLSSPSP